MDSEELQLKVRLIHNSWVKHLVYDLISDWSELLGRDTLQVLGEAADTEVGNVASSNI